jgi:hypothetical protein
LHPAHVIGNKVEGKRVLDQILGVFIGIGKPVFEVFARLGQRCPAAK